MGFVLGKAGADAEDISADATTGWILVGPCADFNV